MKNDSFETLSDQKRSARMPGPFRSDQSADVQADVQAVTFAAATGTPLIGIVFAGPVDGCKDPHETSSHASD